MKTFAFASALVAAILSSGAAQAATVLKSYNLEAYKNGALIISGTFSVNVEADTVNTSVYWQNATLAAANLKLGSTTFTLANTDLFRNSSPLSYDDPTLYTLYGKPSTGVAGTTDDFSFTFNPYKGTFANNFLYATANPAIGGTFADRIVLTAAAVPEPATWALMIGGFAIAGAAMRRRTATSSVRFA
jgi:hypothetical protein